MSITVTLIAQVLAFTILIWLVNKYMWAPINEVLEARRKKIADGLAASEKGQEEMERAAERATQVIKAAKQEAAEIIVQAQARSGQIVDDAKHKAVDEAERVKTASMAEIDQEINRAKDTLRTQVSALAVSGASKILSREIDAKAHKQALDDLVAQI